MKKVVDDLLIKNSNLSNHLIVLPSKRSGVFFKETLKENLNKNQFLPRIISIDTFIEELSKLNLLDNTELLFKFYQVYLEITPKSNIEPFDKFIQWAPIVLQDFNEIDQYLLDANYLFTYLSDIKRIENWFKNEDSGTSLTKKYISYFANLKKYYTSLSNKLLQNNNAYQGLMYRKAHQKVKKYSSENHIVFIGLNALNKAEEEIITELLSQNKASIYFDLDTYIAKKNTSYSKFILSYKKRWNHYNIHPFTYESNEFIKPKYIEVIGIPKNVSQIKYAGQLLKTIHKSHKTYQDTALILANENLLPVALNSLPKEVEHVNITMGYPLKHSAVFSFYKSIIKLQVKKNTGKHHNGFYYKDVLSVLTHSIFQPVLKNFSIEIDVIISNHIIKNNKTILSLTEIENLFKNTKIKQLIKLIFTNYTNVNYFLDTILLLTISILEYTSNSLEKEYLLKMNQIFNQIKNLNNTYNFIQSIETIESVFKQLIQLETLSFQGEPLKGLQILGMLETRSLDFKNIIITSVNEGFLPAGKGTNSFIPFDVKKEIGLPTYTEKDAIFAYHFFRILQRAENIYLLYNTETDEFGSAEKSRFLLQLEQIEKELSKHQLIQKIVSPNTKKEPNLPLKIEKNQKVIHLIDVYNSTKGFSPSALTTYVANPIYFYQKQILDIKNIDEIEEIIALNTLGTIIHEVLELFYKPHINKILIVEDIKKMLSTINTTTLQIFKKHFKEGDFKSGKNLLIFEIAKQYIFNFLQEEIKELNKGNEIIILALEKKLESEIYIENKKFKLNGFVDRIDSYNGIIRIIDYKTGKVEKRELHTSNWELMLTNYKKYSKSFQVLFYAYIYTTNNNINLDNTAIESGVYSFKNLKSGFLKINSGTITKQDLIDFEIELKRLLSEIYNPKIPFVQAENPPY